MCYYIKLRPGGGTTVCGDPINVAHKLGEHEWVSRSAAIFGAKGHKSYLCGLRKSFDYYWAARITLKIISYEKIFKAM
jgi:hypothetical protein